MAETILTVQDLKTHFFLEEGVLKAVDGVDFAIKTEQTLGMIGESGCGKSVTAQSILRIVPKPGRIVSGKIVLSRNGAGSMDLANLDPHGSAIRSIRGKDISMIFQEPMTSLSPVHTIGNQIMESLLIHRTRDKKEAEEIAVDMLNRVGISNASQRIKEYPHQLSGGLRQRAMIAMALSCHPALLIADEPTTALDVTVQAQILELIKSLQEQFGMSVLYITHDLGVIAEISDSVAVMYLGKVVEFADVGSLFKRPLHPYTKLLLKSIPKLGRKARTRLEAIKGTVPIPLDPPEECGFRSRCPDLDNGICRRGIPPLVEAEPGHFVRCHYYESRGKR
jgi:oligopeptide/dipeptide ABC transporter ATP-binding protein